MPYLLLPSTPTLEQLCTRVVQKSMSPGTTSPSRTMANRASLLRALAEAMRWSMTDSADALRPAALPGVLVLIAQLPAKEQRRYDLATAARWWSSTLEAEWPQARSAMANDEKADRLHKQKTLKSTLRNAIEQSGLSQQRVADQAGMPVSSLERWLRGSLPDSRSASNLQALENVLHLPRGTLLQLVSHRLDGPTPKKVRSNYGEYLKSCRQTRYLMQDSEISTALRLQFTRLVQHQTTGFPETPRAEQAGWRTHLEWRQGALQWFNTVNKQYCPSADAAWRRIVSLLSWVANIGNDNLPAVGAEGAQTLGWLIVPAAVEGYLDWHESRAAGFNSGARNLCQTLHALTVQHTGWLRHQPGIAGALPEPCRPADWAAACDAIASFAKSRQRKAAGEREKVQRTRDPFEGLAYFLQHDDPAEPVLNAIDALLLEADSLAAGSKLRAVRLRDAALLAFLLLVPVRQATASKLRAAGPRLHVEVSGQVLRVNIPAKLLKNGHRLGALQTSVDSELSEVIGRYITEGRPALLGGRPDAGHLFLSSGPNQSGPWGHLSQTCVAVTARLCEGHGLPEHSMRHLVASRHLRLHPGDFVGVATLLHDTLETVLKTYVPKDPTGAVARHASSLRLRR